MTEHLPECPKSGCPACYEQGQRACKATHAVLGLKEITRIAGKGYDEGQRDALTAAREAVEAMDLHGCLPHPGPIGCNCIGPQVIAAIDALRKDN